MYKKQPPTLSRTSQPAWSEKFHPIALPGKQFRSPAMNYVTNRNHFRIKSTWPLPTLPLSFLSTNFPGIRAALPAAILSTIHHLVRANSVHLKFRRSSPLKVCSLSSDFHPNHLVPSPNVQRRSLRDVRTGTRHFTPGWIFNRLQSLERASARAARLGDWRPGRSGKEREEKNTAIR